jgi:hypothetical protein
MTVLYIQNSKLNRERFTDSYVHPTVRNLIDNHRTAVLGCIVSATLGIGMAASVLPDVKAAHNAPRLVFRPVVYRPRTAGDQGGIQIELAVTSQAVSGAGTERPAPTPRVRAATPDTEAPRFMDAALVSDRSDDQARQPPPDADADPDADPGPPDNRRWDDRPPPPDADYGDRDDYGEPDR